MSPPLTLALLLLGGPAASPSTGDRAPVPAGPTPVVVEAADNWIRTFAEDFSGDTLDPALWKFGGQRPADGDFAIDPRNVLVRDGILKIAATYHANPEDRAYQHHEPRPWSAGMISTYDRFRQTGGYFEARLRYDNVPWFHPAFWSMPNRPVPQTSDQRRYVTYLQADLADALPPEASIVRARMTLAFAGYDRIASWATCADEQGTGCAPYALAHGETADHRTCPAERHRTAYVGIAPAAPFDPAQVAWTDRPEALGAIPSDIWHRPRIGEGVPGAGALMRFDVTADLRAARARDGVAAFVLADDFAGECAVAIARPDADAGTGLVVDFETDGGAVGTVTVPTDGSYANSWHTAKTRSYADEPYLWVRGDGHSGYQLSPIAAGTPGAAYREIGTEFDIAEGFYAPRGPTQISGNLHYGGYASPKREVGEVQHIYSNLITLPEGESFEDWHTYGLYWAPSGEGHPGRAEWYVDQTCVATTARDRTCIGTPAPKVATGTQSRFSRATVYEEAGEKKVDWRSGEPDLPAFVDIGQAISAVPQFLIVNLALNNFKGLGGEERPTALYGDDPETSPGLYVDYVAAWCRAEDERCLGSPTP